MKITLKTVEKGVRNSIKAASYGFLLLSTKVFAALPGNFTPATGGSATDPVANTWAWVEEIGGYAVAGVMGCLFLWCGIHLYACFGECRKTKHWGEFLITLVVAIITVVVGLWCLSEASAAFTAG